MMLIAVVLGASTLVYSAASRMAASAQGGAAVAISSATIKEGVDVAVERILVANTGSVVLNSFTVTTIGASSSATFYLSLLLPSTGFAVSSSCGAGTNPMSVPVCLNLSPGQSVVVTITIDAGPFTVGTPYTVIVSSQQAAQASQRVLAAPA